MSVLLEGLAFSKFIQLSEAQSRGGYNSGEARAGLRLLGEEGFW